jgi:phospholipid transport system substrate-binding protein
MRASDRRDARATRRGALAGLAALAAALALPRAAAATAVSRAEALVGAISADLARVVSAGLPEARLYGEFERILARYGDMPAVAASVLGPPWRSASSARKQAFVAAFQGYVARKYGRQLGEFRGARIDVLGARDAGRAGVLVQTVVVRPGHPNLAVDWQVSERSGTPRAVNLVIEGVSMLANERAEIGAMLDAQRGSLDGLIAQMRGRA